MMLSSRHNLRNMHIAAAVFNLVFIYTPLHDWPYGFAVVQYISMPLLLVSGVVLARLKKRPLQTA